MNEYFSTLTQLPLMQDTFSMWNLELYGGTLPRTDRHKVSLNVHTFRGIFKWKPQIKHTESHFSIKRCSLFLAVGSVCTTSCHCVFVFFAAHQPQFCFAFRSNMQIHTCIQYIGCRFFLFKWRRRRLNDSLKHLLWPQCKVRVQHCQWKAEQSQKE